jgi:DNA-binding response OmpR family regulator
MGSNERPSCILIVDDDDIARAILRQCLETEGFEVRDAAGGVAMRAVLMREPVDLVLLDLIMPGEDGLSLLRDIRGKSSIPIIMLTSRGEARDRIVGLDAGVDDYIAKPFEPLEVAARVRTVLRRARLADPGRETAGASSLVAAGPVVVFSGWRVDLARRGLQAPDGRSVELTTREFDLLAAFVGMPNRILSRDELVTLVKGREWAANGRMIDNQVACLRRKIEVDPRNPELIKTIHGAGYLFTAGVEVFKDDA